MLQNIKKNSAKVRSASKVSVLLYSAVFYTKFCCKSISVPCYDERFSWSFATVEHGAILKRALILAILVSLASLRNAQNTPEH